MLGGVTLLRVKHFVTCAGGFGKLDWAAFDGARPLSNTCAGMGWLRSAPRAALKGLQQEALRGKLSLKDMCVLFLDPLCPSLLLSLEV